MAKLIFNYSSSNASDPLVHLCPPPPPPLQPESLPPHAQLLLLLQQGYPIRCHYSRFSHRLCRAEQFFTIDFTSCRSSLHLAESILNNHPCSTEFPVEHMLFCCKSSGVLTVQNTHSKTAHFHQLHLWGLWRASLYDWNSHRYSCGARICMCEPLMALTQCGSPQLLSK